MKDYVWCLNCGFDLFVKDGHSKDGRQRLKCNICGTRTTEKALRQGERMPNEEMFLPFLRKENDELTNGELYALGFVMADGTLTTNNGSPKLGINILERDVEVLEIVRRELEIPNPIGYYTRFDTGQKTVAIGWQNKYAWAAFSKKGLELNKTGNEVWLPYMNNHHFIRGVFDGDGCFFINKEKHKYELSFTSGCKEYLENLNAALKNMFGVGAAKVATQRNKTGNAYRITIYKRAILKIGPQLYEDSDNLRLERKYKKYLEINNG